MTAADNAPIIVITGVIAFVGIISLTLNVILWSRLMASKQEVLDKIKAVSDGVDRLIAQGGGGTGAADLEEVSNALDPVLSKLPADTFGAPVDPDAPQV